MSSTSSALISGGGVLSTLICVFAGSGAGSAGFDGATTSFFGSSISIFAFTLAPNLILSPDLSPTVVILFPFTYVPFVEPRSCSIQAPFLQQMNA